MLLAVVGLWLAAIVGFVPAVVAQDQFDPFYLYIFLKSDITFRAASVTDNNGVTYLFRPYMDSMSTFKIYETVDFFRFPESRNLVTHLAGGDVIPLFIVYDRNTAGFSQDFLVGYKDEKTGKLNVFPLLSDDDPVGTLCEDCIKGNITGEVSTWWDTKRNRWVSVVDTDPGTSFAVSNDLKVWSIKNFLPNVDPAVLANAIEVFPIADDDDPSKVTWIIIRKSNTDPSKLLYSTFVPDDANPQYKEMGVLDGSTNWEDFVVINSNSTDYRHRKVVAIKRAEYRKYNVLYNIYISFRKLFYSGGKLRQLPISTVFPKTPTYERLFPSVSFTPGDSVFSCLRPSVALTIEAEMKPTPTNMSFGFDLFISETDKDDYAASFVINLKTKKIYLVRYNWFSAGDVVPNDSYKWVYLNYDPVGIDVYKVLIVVDTISVESFVLDGLYVQSIFIFPRSDMKHHEVYSSSPLEISNMKVRIFD